MVDASVVLAPVVEEADNGEEEKKEEEEENEDLRKADTELWCSKHFTVWITSIRTFFHVVCVSLYPNSMRVSQT